MGDHDDCWLIYKLISSQALDRLLNHVFAVGVKSWGCLIKYYYFWLSEESSCYRYSLSLSTAKLVTFFSDLGLKHIWEAFVVAEKLHAACLLSSINNIFLRGVVVAIYYVRPYCSREESGFLVDKAYLFSKVGCVDWFLLVIPVPDAAWFDLIKFFDEFDDGWFSWAALSNKGDILSFIDCEGDISQCDSLR